MIWRLNVRLHSRKSGQMGLLGYARGINVTLLSSKGVICIVMMVIRLNSETLCHFDIIQYRPQRNWNLVYRTLSLHFHMLLDTSLSSPLTLLLFQFVYLRPQCELIMKTLTAATGLPGPQSESRLGFGYVCVCAWIVTINCRFLPRHGTSSSFTCRKRSPQMDASLKLRKIA
jgi:hypothetical protein